MNSKLFSEWRRTEKRRLLVMGVVNVTPDSFSDGGQFFDSAKAIDHALRLNAEGADLLDLGGETTRPGSSPTPPDEQIRRILPVIHSVCRQLPDIIVSIDTTRARVAEVALDNGAQMINDVSAGLDDADLLPLVARKKVPVILMHRQGTPATMQVNPGYKNVVEEIVSFLRARAEFARTAGVEIADILLDPGFGFGKTTAHNLTLLKRLSSLASQLAPHAILVGTSRKSFIGLVTGEKDASGRQFGTAGTVAWAMTNGADIVRVHDVQAMVRVVRMIEAIQSPED